MKSRPVQRGLAALALAGVAGAAHAQALSWDPSWAFSGFGTAAYAKTDTRLGQLANPAQPNGVDQGGSFAIDSLLGAQVNAKANSVFSATVQAISQRNGRGNFKPGIDWAFIKAQATPEFGLRIGRIGAPDFMVSDYRHVNYSNLWVRPPLDVYGQVSFDHFDGADAIYQKSVGSATFTSQVFGGTGSNYSDDVRIHVRNQVGFNLGVEFDNGLTLRAGRAQGKLTFDSAGLDQLTGILSQLGFGSVAGQMTGRHASFTGFSAAYDHDNLIGSVEYTRRRTQNVTADTTGWAATGGYRFGKFTPFAVVSRLKVDSANVDNTLPRNVAPLAPLVAAIDGILQGGQVGERTKSLGVRWDGWKNIALKAQYDHITPDAGAVGEFVNVKPGFGEPVNAYTVSVDFVF